MTHTLDYVVAPRQCGKRAALQRVMETSSPDDLTGYGERLLAELRRQNDQWRATATPAEIDVVDAGLDWILHGEVLYDAATGHVIRRDELAGPDVIPGIAARARAQLDPLPLPHRL